MRDGMNQLNGRKIMILDFVSSDMVKNQLCVKYFFIERIIDRLPISKNHPKNLFMFVVPIEDN